MKKDFEYKVNEKWLLTPFGADERVLLARAKFMLETNKLSVSLWLDCGQGKERLCSFIFELIFS
mgnify:CR=1 FL=1